MTRRQKVWAAILPGMLMLLAIIAEPVKAQVTRAPSFLAEKYEVSAYVDTIAQGINAVAKVEFRAQEVSSSVRVELHENLEVKEVKSAEGKALSFQREAENPLYLMVSLPGAVGAGKTVTLTFAYGGVLGNEGKRPG